MKTNETIQNNDPEPEPEKLNNPIMSLEKKPIAPLLEQPWKKPGPKALEKLKADWAHVT